MVENHNFPLGSSAEHNLSDNGGPVDPGMQNKRLPTNIVKFIFRCTQNGIPCHISSKSFMYAGFGVLQTFFYTSLLFGFPSNR